MYSDQYELIQFDSDDGTCSGSVIADKKGLANDTCYSTAGDLKLGCAAFTVYSSPSHTPLQYTLNCATSGGAGCFDTANEVFTLYPTECTRPTFETAWTTDTMIKQYPAPGIRVAKDIIHMPKNA